MKKFLFIAMALCLLIGMPSCKKAVKGLLSDAGMDGSKSFADIEVLNDVKQNLISKCDTTKMPIYKIFFFENEECSGRSPMYSIFMVNAEGTQSYTQSFFFNGDAASINDDGQPSCEDVEHINLAELDMNKIVKGIDNAKSLIPDGYKFRVVRQLTINPDITELTMALTKVGEETVSNAGQTSEVYYDALYEINNKTGEAIDKN